MTKSRRQIYRQKRRSECWKGHEATDEKSLVASAAVGNSGRGRRCTGKSLASKSAEQWGNWTRHHLHEITEYGQRRFKFKMKPFLKIADTFDAACIGIAVHGAAAGRATAHE